MYFYIVLTFYKNFTKFIRKHLHQSLFLMKLHHDPTTLLKNCLQLWGTFGENRFRRTTLGDCSQHFEKVIFHNISRRIFLQETIPHSQQHFVKTFLQKLSVGDALNNSTFYSDSERYITYFLLINILFGQLLLTAELQLSVAQIYTSI